MTAQMYVLYASATGAETLAELAMDDVDVAEEFGLLFFNEVVVTSKLL